MFNLPSLCFCVCLSVSTQLIKFWAFLAFSLMFLWCGCFAAASGECRHWQVSVLNLQISKSDCCLCGAPVWLTVACKQQRFLIQCDTEEYGELNQLKNERFCSPDPVKHTHTWSADVRGIVWKYSWHVFKTLRAVLRVCWMGQWGLTGEKQSGVRDTHLISSDCPQTHDLKRLHVYTWTLGFQTI